MQFKRGDTFVLAATYRDDAGNPANLAGYTVRAQVRHGRRLVDELSFAATDLAQGSFTMSASAAQTAAWPIGEVACDIRYQSPDGVVTSSEVFRITVVGGITQPPGVAE